MTPHPKPIHAGMSAREYEEAMAVKGEPMPADLDLSEMERVRAEATGFEWHYVESTEHHGPYVAALSGDIADCYAMSNPAALSVRNGGTSRPIPHQHEKADANARFIAYAANAWPALVEAVRERDRLREALEKARLIAVDAQLRASYQRTALEEISAIARAALAEQKADHD